MLVTCLVVCHDKPEFTHEAIDSLLRQTHTHWHAVVSDSGTLFDAGYYDRFHWRRDPRIRLVRSTETDETRRTRAMAPWCFNECFRNGLVRGELVTYLCDDDVWYPNAFATFAAYFGRNPHVAALYASQDVGVIHPDGRRAVVGQRRALGLGGKCVSGRVMDCQVDYLQLCHRRSVLDLLGDPWWPEGKETESHADGVFMERLGEHVPIVPHDVTVGQNRRTPRSTYVPSQVRVDRPAARLV
jgi:hypothetical protein